jgi:hypothetical protein
MVAYTARKNPLAMATGAPAPAPAYDISADAYQPGAMRSAPNTPPPMAASTVSPFSPPQGPPRNALLASALDGFQRGFDPAGFEKRQATNKAAEGDKLKQTLALMQQQRAIPEAQRGQWWQQNAPTISKIIGQDVSQMPLDVSKFSDQELDGQIAALSAQAGIGPVVQEPMSLYEERMLKLREQEAGQPTPFNLGGGAFGEYNPTAPDGSRLTMLRQPTEPPADLPEGMWYGQDGKGPPQPIPGYVNMRAQIAAAGRAPSTSDTPLRNLTPEEVRARGYPAGTVVQVDGTNREFVRSRSSTAQGGQPTESERAAGLHAQISLNGLRQLMAMEQEGYNRAGVSEQLFGSTFGLEKERLYDQSADEFIDGYLRAMTGAAATKQEIETYKKQWFPTWGDTPAVIAQKSSGRLNAIQAMKSKAGRSWNPSWDALLSGMQGQGVSSSPMQMATEQGAETVPGMNWNGAQMNYQSAPAGDLSGYSTEDLQRMLAEAEGQ